MSPRRASRKSALSPRCGSPRIEERFRRYIESELDELEREDFTRLKKVKDQNSARAAAAAEKKKAALYVEETDVFDDKIDADVVM